MVGHQFQYTLLGTNTEDNTFTIRYCNKMIKEDGINWIENNGEREMIAGVTFGTVKAEVELFHKAIGRIRALSRTEFLMAKETLKQSVSDLMRASEGVNVADLQTVANECSGLGKTESVWNHERVLKVGSFVHNNSCQLETSCL